MAHRLLFQSTTEAVPQAEVKAPSVAAFESQEPSSEGASPMKRVIFPVLITAGLLFTTGCATKNYVRKETAPIVNKVNELDDLTAQNSRDIKDVDSRATQGIQGAQAKADAADQKALAAGKTADDANVLATQASTRVDALHNTVANLD